MEASAWVPDLGNEIIRTNLELPETGLFRLNFIER